MPAIINIAPNKWYIINFSSKSIIAIIEPNTGIKCKNTPARLAPIIAIPLIQKKKEARPGNITTYDKVKINGFPSTI